MKQYTVVYFENGNQYRIKTFNLFDMAIKFYSNIRKKGEYGYMV